MQKNDRLSFELVSTIFQTGINQMIQEDASFKSQLLVAEMFDALWEDIKSYRPGVFEIRILVDDNLDSYTHSIKFSLNDGEAPEGEYLITIHRGFLNYEIYRHIDYGVTGKYVPLKKSKIHGRDT